MMATVQTSSDVSQDPTVRRHSLAAPKINRQQKPAANKKKAQLSSPPAPDKVKVKPYREMTDAELDEFCGRQQKILDNKLLVNRLADRGQKLREKLAQAQAERDERRRRHELALQDATDALQALSMTQPDTAAEQTTSKGQKYSKDSAEGSVAQVDEPKYVHKVTEMTSRASQQPSSDHHHEKFQPFKTLKHSRQVDPAKVAKWTSDMPGLNTAVCHHSLAALNTRQSLELAAAAQQLSQQQAGHSSQDQPRHDEELGCGPAFREWRPHGTSDGHDSDDDDSDHESHQDDNEDQDDAGGEAAAQSFLETLD